MISAATGAMALVMVPLVRDHGVEYLFAATILAGAFQVAFGALGVGKLMRFIPRSVMTGFVNALAILIFTAQLEHVVGGGPDGVPDGRGGRRHHLPVPEGHHRHPLPARGHRRRRWLGRAVRSSSCRPWATWASCRRRCRDCHCRTCRGRSRRSSIIAPVAFTLAVVGLLESLLTAQLMDDMTDENSDTGRESRGQGIANVATGFLGGMAGCAMIGQSMINLRSGGRTRLSTLSAGLFLLVLILVAGPVVAAIPMAALVAVMIVVAVSTFDWASVRPSSLRRTPRSETAVMVVTVAIVVITHNLALGVLAGVLLSAIFFARRVAHLVEVTDVVDPVAEVRTYHVTGELFFASTNEMVHAFDYFEPTPNVVIDLSDAHVWDSSAVAVLDTIVDKFARHGTHAEIIGLNAPSTELHERLSGHLNSEH